MSESEKNLMAAFAGESQANRKYLAFAKKAEDDGFPGVAKLFKAAAAAETVHAHNHLGVAGGINGTLDNLKEAFDGEHYEFSDMYPGFLDKAKEEKNNKALQSFHWANEVEKIHGGLYEEAIKIVESGKTSPYRNTTSALSAATPSPTALRTNALSAAGRKKCSQRSNKSFLIEAIDIADRSERSFNLPGNTGRIGAGPILPQRLPADLLYL